MGRSQFTVAGAAAAFGLATVIIAAQAPAQPPAGQGQGQPAGRGQGQPAPAQPGGPPPNPADPSLPQGQGGGRGAGAPVFQSARADIKGASGISGTATFYEISNGGNGHMVQIILMVQNAPAGLHGVHIHGTGRCEGPDFKSAGGHFDPGPAGNPDPEVNHAFHMGDLPNITINAQGTGQYNIYSTRLTMGGPTGMFDADGSAIVIHQNLDTMVPGATGSGVSGGPAIACGVIERS